LKPDDNPDRIAQHTDGSSPRILCSPMPPTVLLVRLQNAHLFAPVTTALVAYIIVVLSPTPSGNEVYLWFVWPILFPVFVLACYLQYLTSVLPAASLFPSLTLKSVLLFMATSVGIGCLVGLVLFGWMFSKEQFWNGAVIGGALSFVESFVVVLKTLSLRLSRTWCIQPHQVS